MKKKAKKMSTNAKHKQEGQLLEKLQLEHGYTLMEPGRGMEKTQLMFDRQKGKAEVAYVMRLAVPADSALGQAIAKMREAKLDDKKKGRKR